MSNIKFVKSKYENSKKDIIRLTDQTEYATIINHYDYLITKLSEELQSLPIGYRYTGKFYLKKPYTLPTVFEEYDGSVYLREDLISWQIDSGLDYKDYSYHRIVFKVPKEGSEFELKREDAEPVYAKDFQPVTTD